MHNWGVAKRRALRIVRKTQPATLLDAVDIAGLNLREIGAGCGSFRRTYRVVGTNLVIKFPKIGEECKQHTKDEVRKIRALSKFKSLRPHLPPVYYYNGRDGVMVTDYYPYICPEKSKNVILSDVIRELTGIHLDDIMGDNVRSKEKGGNPIFCDCGY